MVTRSSAGEGLRDVHAALCAERVAEVLAVFDEMAVDKDSDVRPQAALVVEELAA